MGKYRAFEEYLWIVEPGQLLKVDTQGRTAERILIDSIASMDVILPKEPAPDISTLQIHYRGTHDRPRDSVQIFLHGRDAADQLRSEVEDDQKGRQAEERVKV